MSNYTLYASNHGVEHRAALQALHRIGASDTKQVGGVIFFRSEQSWEAVQTYFDKMGMLIGCPDRNKPAEGAR